MSRRAKPWAAAPRRGLAEERGMTIVEAVVAALVFVIMALGVLQVVDASTRNTFRAEQSQVVVNRLQAELEDVRQLTYDEVALTEEPIHVDDPANPNWRVSNGQFTVPRDSDAAAPLVYQGSPLEGGGQVGDPIPAAVEPGPEPYQSGDVSGQIYRYVVWIEDEACGASCPGSQDLKRVIVIAALDDTASGGTRSYQELHTDIVDPDTEPVDNALPPGSENDTLPATFLLTDTPCDQDARQSIAGPHDTHNTHGACSDGMETGDMEPGAPGLMFTVPPEEETAELFDYSADVGSGPGLRMRAPESPGCLRPGDFGPNEEEKQTKFHVWLSRPMPPEYAEAPFALTGDATLQLSVSTVDEIAAPGRICVWLFKRHLDSGQPDTFTQNLDPPEPGAVYYHGDLAPEDVPSPEQWTEIFVPMSFDTPFDVAGGERLGLAIAVEREGSGEEQLEFMYDHPLFPSRLQVETTSPLDPLLGN